MAQTHAMQNPMSTPANRLPLPAKRLPPSAKTCHDLPRTVRFNAVCVQRHRPSVQSGGGIKNVDLSGGPAVAEVLSADVAAVTFDVPSRKTAQARFQPATVCHSQILSIRVRPAGADDRGRFSSRLRGASRCLADVDLETNDGTLIIGVPEPFNEGPSTCG